MVLFRAAHVEERLLELGLILMLVAMSYSATQTITDAPTPVFSAAPSDVTVEDDAGFVNNYMDWTDNCDGSGTVNATDGDQAHVAER